MPFMDFQRERVRADSLLVAFQDSKMPRTIDETRGEGKVSVDVAVRETRTNLQGTGRVLERFERLVLKRELDADRIEQSRLLDLVVRGGELRTQLVDGFHVMHPASPKRVHYGPGIDARNDSWRPECRCSLAPSPMTLWTVLR